MPRHLRTSGGSLSLAVCLHVPRVLDHSHHSYAIHSVVFYCVLPCSTPVHALVVLAVSRLSTSLLHPCSLPHSYYSPGSAFLEGFLGLLVGHIHCPLAMLQNHTPTPCSLPHSYCSPGSAFLDHSHYSHSSCHGVITHLPQLLSARLFLSQRFFWVC